MLGCAQEALPCKWHLPKRTKKEKGIYLAAPGKPLQVSKLHYKCWGLEKFAMHKKTQQKLSDPHHQRLRLKRNRLALPRKHNKATPSTRTGAIERGICSVMPWKCHQVSDTNYQVLRQKGESFWWNPENVISWVTPTIKLWHRNEILLGSFWKAFPGKDLRHQGLRQNRESAWWCMKSISR